jgi:hypothetical protein
MAKKKQEQLTTQEIEVQHFITPVQLLFIEHLLTSKTIAESARLAGCSIRSAMYWLHDLDHPVRREYDLQRTQQQALFSERVAHIHDLAFQAIVDLLSPDAPETIRFQTVKLLYDDQLSYKLRIARPEQSQQLIADEVLSRRDEQQVLNHFALYDDLGRSRIVEDE